MQITSNNQTGATDLTLLDFMQQQAQELLFCCSFPQARSTSCLSELGLDLASHTPGLTGSGNIPHIF